MLTYLQHCWRYRYVIAAAAAVSAVVGWASAVLRPARFESTATVRVRVPRFSVYDEGPTVISINEALALLREDGLVQRAIGDARPDRSGRTTGRVNVDVAIVPGTTLLRVRVTSGDPSESSGIANRLLESARAEHQRRETTRLEAERERLNTLLDGAAQHLDQITPPARTASTDARRRLDYDAAERVYSDLAQRLALLDGRIQLMP